MAIDAPQSPAPRNNATTTSSTYPQNRSSGSSGIETKKMFSTNRSRAILIALLTLIPLLSYRDEILSIFVFSQPLPLDSSERISEAFNSYKLNLPLFEAVKSNDLGLVRKLLEGGIDGKQGGGASHISFYNVNAEDSKGITPLIEATLLGNVELVELLLLHGARAQPSPGFRHTPLRAACLTANTKLITLLLEKGADPNAQSEGGRTPLMGACFLRPQYDEMPNRLELSYEAVRTMLADSRTDPRIRNEFDESALELCRAREYNKSMAYIRDKVLSGGGGKSPGKWKKKLGGGKT